MMKSIGILSTSVLFLLLGFSATAVAHQEPQEKPQDQENLGKPPGWQPQEKPAEAAKQEHQEPSKPAAPPKQEQQAKPQPQQQEHTQQQAKSQQDQQQKQQHQQQSNDAKQHPQQASQQQQHSEQQPHVRQVNMQSPQEQHRQESEQHDAWQEHRAHNWESEHRSWQQRGGYHGYRIPDDRYNDYFGPSHTFRVYSYPVMMVGGYPRFQYGGYWFSLADPWPEYWSNDWYDNDDVYVDYSNDGYYLYNRRYPNDRIAINVYMN